MVFTVRCFKCGSDSVRLIMGNRAILHAKCHDCSTNLLAEVLALEEQCELKEDAPCTQEFIADPEEIELLESSG